MSFSIKNNNDKLFIFENSATSLRSDNWSENGNNIYNNNTGNVGINISNPLYNLDVSGTTNITGNLRVDTNVLLVDVSNNRVGINTSNPSYALDVSGDIRVNTIYYTSLNPPLTLTNYASVRTTDALSISTVSGTFTPITFNFVTNGANGVIINGWTYTAGNFICPASGRYLISCQLLANNTSGGNTLGVLRLRINSSQSLGGFIPQSINSNNSGTSVGGTISWMYNLSANDTISISANANGSAEAYSVSLAYLTITPL